MRKIQKGVSLLPETWELLKNIADRENRSMSFVIENHLKELVYAEKGATTEIDRLNWIISRKEQQIEGLKQGIRKMLNKLGYVVDTPIESTIESDYPYRVKCGHCGFHFNLVNLDENPKNCYFCNCLVMWNR